MFSTKRLLTARITDSNEVLLKAPPPAQAEGRRQIKSHQVQEVCSLNRVNRPNDFVAWYYSGRDGN